MKHLFAELSEKLQFPNYFGQNWDDLNDCLNDLTWINEKDITIVHDSSINLNEKDFEIYIDIINSAVLNWISNTSHSLKVVFRTDYKERVEYLLKNRT